MTITEIINSKSNRLFLVLAGFFIVNAVVAEFVGIKIFSLEQTLGFQAMDISLFGENGLGFNLTAGVLLWPVIFIMTDIINEYFGPKTVRLLSYMTIALILYAFIMVFGTIQLSPNQWWDQVSGINNENASLGVSSMNMAYKKIMGQGLWIIVGSMIAFLVGQIVDVMVFHKIKQATGENKIWLRATGSTLVSQLIDSYVVLLVAFWIGSDWPLVRVLAIGTMNYIYKFIVALLLTPVIYIVHDIIEKYLGHDLATSLKSEANNKFI